MSGTAKAGHGRAEEYVRIRMIVGLAGERSDPPWWSSMFGSGPAMRFFPEQLFSRTSAGATINALVRAAAVHHDRFVPATSTYHLFRLPVHLEAELDSFLRERRQTVADWLSASRSATFDDLLSMLPSDSESAQQPTGPLACGSSRDLEKPAAAARIGATYAGALRSVTTVVPYFVKEPAR